MAADAARWWPGAVVYQIYPRSFRDSDGDGVGDLPGILAGLDHVARLGADAIWLSPIHPSPNRDFGYDVSDYCAIEPSLGSMADFDRLLGAVHGRGLKLILDEVLSHTSDEHPWFLESRSSRDNPKSDWYVWAEPKLDGSPPNNWASAFGGPAWAYWPERRQYFFAKFFRQQPKLNLHNPAVVDAALGALRFWLDKGVDGFRLDVAHSFLHEAGLRDNPPVPLDKRTPRHWAFASALQEHVYDNGFPDDGVVRPEHRMVLERIRTLTDAYDNRFVFGEFAEEPHLMGGYCGERHGVHSGYNFAYLYSNRFAPKAFAAEIEALNRFPDLFPCITFSNHDVSRTVSRYTKGGVRDDALAKCAMTLLMSLRGTVLLYQGEELGLGDAPIKRSEIRDPFGDLYYPLFKGRDPVRTGMPWEGAGPHAGFTTGTPWLPVPGAHASQAIGVQERDPDSVLNFTRALIARRKTLAPLIRGSISVSEASDAILAFERQYRDERILCVFNLSRAEAAFNIAPYTDFSPLSFGHSDARIGGTTVALPPLTTAFFIHRS